MDQITVKHYTDAADQRIVAYEARDVSSLHELMLRHFEEGSQLLEIGCGSGRDAAFLLSHCRAVTATDASEGMIEAAEKKHPELATQLKCVPFPLPDGHDLLKQTFDGIYAVAVLMHVPDEELFEFAFQTKSLLRSGGTLLLSFSTSRAGLSDDRDQAGRLFLERSPGEIQLLFERLGFRLLEQHQNDDGMARQLQWHTLVLSLTERTGNGPVDQIETIINRDRKDATYKLALLRALCDIAQTEYHQALWGQDNTVSVPLGLVAEKWLFYYWPIVEAELGYDGERVVIPQKRGLNQSMAFRKDLTTLIAHCRQGGGGLNTFHADFRSGLLPADVATLADAALNSISKTIVVGPIKYTGGAIDDKRQFFWQDGAQTKKHHCGSSQELTASLGRIHMRGEIWRELALVGHWISEAIILRWAELTHEISRKQVTIATVVDKLLILPEPGRDQKRVRQIYRNLPDLKCVWTEDAIGPRRKFEVDHVIPFSLWHNNDLWNLMPATRKANNSKRDMLVTRGRLFESRELIIDYWQTTRNTMPDRFDYELQRSLLGSSFQKGNWEIPAFSALTEAIESVACQRGIPRWPGCKSNTVSVVSVLPPSADLVEQQPVIELPFFPDLKIACGAFGEGIVDEAETITIENPHGNLDPKRHFVVRTQGDSMDGGNKPIKDGDLVLLEHIDSQHAGSITSERAIAVEYQDGTGGLAYALKQIKKDSSGQYQLTSWNPSFPVMPVDPEQMFTLARFLRVVTPIGCRGESGR